MRIVLLSFFLTFLLPAAASDSLYTHVFEPGAEVRINFTDSIDFLLDAERALDIEAVLRDHQSDFGLQKPQEMPEGAYAVWSRIQLKNASHKTINSHFMFCSLPDTIWMYTIKDGREISRQLSGALVELKAKAIPVSQNFLPFGIEPGELKTFYFRVYFNRNVGPGHLAELFTRPSRPLIDWVINGYTTQSFFAGIMLLFCLASMFMFVVFRERVFIYFSLLMFFFGLYFPEIHGLLNYLHIFSLENNRFSFSLFIISGIVISLFLFVSRYIRLKVHFPRYFVFFAVFSFCLAAFPQLATLIFSRSNWIAKYHNYGLLFWFVSIIIPVLLLARKKDKSARILLISISILFVSSVFFVLGLAFFIPFEGIVKYGIQIGLLIFSAILFYGLFDKVNAIRNEKKRFEELDKLKSRFFANISHEFRTPLTLILDPIRELMEKQDDPKDKQVLDIAHRNANRLLVLINQLLDLSKLEAGKMELEVQEQNFAALLKGIAMSFESLAESRHIRLKVESTADEIPLFVDSDKMEKVFYNLLSNAFKFTPEQGEISVLLTAKDKTVEIQIRDTGIGIPESRLPHIFDRFYQVDSSESRAQEGTGIGLAMVKELIKLHGGNISVESIEGKGSTFQIELLKGKSHFEPQQISPKAKSSQSRHNMPPALPKAEALSPSLISGLPGQENPAGLPLVLVIEDNKDVREYIRGHLRDSFYVVEAVDGQEGIDKALEQLPDLIISDVMMPHKNGYEVCEILKKEARTSHIPIILLTAKAAQEEKLRGLETGADDYLVKPFDTRELEVRVRNLIELRRQLRQRFSDAPRIEPQAAGTNAVDKAFLEKIVNTIHNHLTDSQLSVESLAEAVGMSRVHLNRKLKALTDYSANKFIQAYRLEQALLLLQQGAGNVSEIAFQTGFGSTAYFVKCFREKYGKTPGEVKM